MRLTLALLTALLLATDSAQAIDYPHQTAEPQKSGWPLTDEERDYVLKPEHERRPGRESNKVQAHLYCHCRCTNVTGQLHCCCSWQRTKN